MKNLEDTLKILETNAADFDIKIFTEDIMSIPFQIKQIDKNIKNLTVSQNKRYSLVLKILKKEALKAEPASQLQKEIISDVLIAIDEEFNKVA